MKLRIAKSAVADLQAIQAYYKEQGVPHIGNDYVAAILQHIEIQQPAPDADRVVPEFNQDNIRELIHAPFRLVYFGKLRTLCSFGSSAMKDCSHYLIAKYKQARKFIEQIRLFYVVGKAVGTIENKSKNH